MALSVDLSSKMEQMSALGTRIFEVNELLDLMNVSREGIDADAWTTRQRWLHELRDKLWAEVGQLAQQLVEGED